MKVKYHTPYRNTKPAAHRMASPRPLHFIKIVLRIIRRRSSNIFLPFSFSRVTCILRNTGWHSHSTFLDFDKYPKPELSQDNNILVVQHCLFPDFTTLYKGMIRAVQIFNIYPSTAMIACLIKKNSAMPPGNASLFSSRGIQILRIPADHGAAG